MGTRGFVGFVVDGEVKAQYTQYDSYPEGLGGDVLDWAGKHCTPEGLPEVMAQARNLRVVDDEVPPTRAEQDQYSQYADLRVSGQTPTEWYVLLRKTQGELDLILEAGVIEDMGTIWPADSLMCEWGYLVNLDEKILEAYQGFQRHKHDLGRFAHLGSEEITPDYYPVALVATFDLAALPSKEEFTMALVHGDD